MYYAFASSRPNASSGHVQQAELDVLTTHEARTGGCIYYGDHIIRASTESRYQSFDVCLAVFVPGLDCTLEWDRKTEEEKDISELPTKLVWRY